MNDFSATSAPVSSELFVSISKKYAGGFKLDVSLTASPGITILFGSSGAGKTTLLDCIAGLASPDSGKIAVSQKVFFDKNINVPLRERGVGCVFQDLALFPHLTVEKNIQYGLAHLSSQERVRRCDTILESFGIANLRTRKPRQISGGEQHRVALARALVTNPRVLLLDEPLAALDAITKSKIIRDLRVWNHEQRIPILYVTHSREEVFALGERVLALEQGQILADGTPHEVMNAPLQETVAQLAGFENVFSSMVVHTNVERGTMSCRLEGTEVELETPLVRAKSGSNLRIGIRAGDILLATVLPQGLSARNILPGKIMALNQRDMIVVARVNCGVEMEVHLTLAARDTLGLHTGQDVWLVIKTHSCHLMTG